MLAILLLRAGLWALSLLFGGVGVFCALLSFGRPALAAHALILVGTGLAINYSLSR
jgi:hypothetical protein